MIVRVANLFLTHVVADANNKTPFFFSQWNFERAHRRGNTHYCFHCGGNHGFKLDDNGAILDSKSDVARIILPNDELMTNQQMLNIPFLLNHVGKTPGYNLYQPSDRGYNDWLDWRAHIDFSDEVAEWVIKSGYTLYRYDPMEHHDPVTHADGIVGQMDKFDYVGDWLRNARRPKGFPFVVSLT